jgi:hypothetical protein
MVRRGRTISEAHGSLNRVRFGHECRLARHDHQGGELIALTAAEIRRLFAIATQTRRHDDYYLRWSRWRRRHQARARRSHYQRRLTNQGLRMRY